MIWDNIENIVLSQIRESLNSNMSTPNEVERAYKSAIGKFTYGNLIEQHWLNELEVMDKNKAEKFKQTINAFKLNHIHYKPYLNLIIGYIIVAAISIVTSATLAFSTDLTLLNIILWGIFAIVVSSGILIPLFNRKQDSLKETIIEEYCQQLEILRHTLIQIIS